MGCDEVGEVVGGFDVALGVGGVELVEEDLVAEELESLV